MTAATRKSITQDTIGTYHDENAPAVWVACLSSYNHGNLHGAWVNVPDSVEEMRELIEQVLQSSPSPDGEEWGFFDNSELAPFDIGEYEDLETLVMYATAINLAKADNNDDAFSVWDYDEYRGDDAESIYNRFKDQYMGCFRDGVEFSESYFDDCNEIPAHLSNYIDYEAVWRDLRNDAYYLKESYADNHVFRSY